MIDQLRQSGAGDWIGSLAVVSLQAIMGVISPATNLSDFLSILMSFALVLALLNVRTFVNNSSLTGAIAAFLVSSTALAAELQDSEDPYLWWRFTGALAGAIFYPVVRKEKKASAWASMVFVGLFCGMAGARMIVDRMEWPPIKEYHLAAGILAGFIGWSFLLAIHQLVPQALKDIIASVFRLNRGRENG